MKKTTAGKAATKEQERKQARGRHTPEFKKLVIARMASEGVAVTARDLGMPESQLYAWRKKATEASSVSEEQRLQSAELAKLKRDNARLQEELAFLKKAAAYFAQNPK